MTANPPDAQNAPPPVAIPLTVIGGFLGAGKTTFLNHLLMQESCRFAVLVNDFGAVNVDAALIRSHDGNTINLNNGCICCTMADGLGEALMRVLAAPQRPEHIVIEASGVGDPWQIAEIAMLEPDMDLAAVIVLADAEQLLTQLADPYIGDTVRRQIRRADLLLLNKIDLADTARLQAAYAALSALRPELRIVETRNAEPPALLLRFAHATRPDNLPPAEPEHGIRRWLYRRKIVFDRKRLEPVLNSLPPALLRLKGWCRIADTTGGEPRFYLLQMTGPRWNLTPAEGTALAVLDQESLLVGLGHAAMPEDTVLAALFDAAAMPTGVIQAVA